MQTHDNPSTAASIEQQTSPQMDLHDKLCLTSAPSPGATVAKQKKSKTTSAAVAQTTSLPNTPKRLRPPSPGQCPGADELQASRPQLPRTQLQGSEQHVIARLSCRMLSTDPRRRFTTYDANHKTHSSRNPSCQTLGCQVSALPNCSATAAKSQCSDNLLQDLSLLSATWRQRPQNSQL